MSRRSNPRVTSAEEEDSTPAEDSNYHYTEDLGSAQSIAQRFGYLAPPSGSSIPYVSPYAPLAQTQPQLFSSSASQPQPSPSPAPSIPASYSTGSSSIQASAARSAHMSTYSSSSQDDAVYSSPGPRRYQFGSSSNAESPLSQSEQETLINSLRQSSNTVIELRRIERLLTQSASRDVIEPLTTAWAYYVNSNNLLSEMRGLTRNYPFSSECLDEAKWMVIGDPASTGSWNYAWLVLVKIRNEILIPKHARLLAVKPTMWGGRLPTSVGAQQLANACIEEWTRALNQMMRHWESPPTLGITPDIVRNILTPHVN